jgi:hypothetical protein
MNLKNMARLNQRYMVMKSSQEIFDAGYAIQVYDPSPTHRAWVFRNERFTTPMDVEPINLDGISVLKYDCTTS